MRAGRSRSPPASFRLDLTAPEPMTLDRRGRDHDRRRRARQGDAVPAEFAGPRRVRATLTDLLLGTQPPQGFTEAWRDADTVVLTSDADAASPFSEITLALRGERPAPRSDRHARARRRSHRPFACEHVALNPAARSGALRAGGRERITDAMPTSRLAAAGDAAAEFLPHTRAVPPARSHRRDRRADRAVREARDGRRSADCSGRRALADAASSRRWRKAPASCSAARSRAPRARRGARRDRPLRDRGQRRRSATQLEIEITVVRRYAGMARIRARASVGARTCATAALTLAFHPARAPSRSDAAARPPSSRAMLVADRCSPSPPGARASSRARPAGGARRGARSSQPATARERSAAAACASRSRCGRPPARPPARLASPAYLAIDGPERPPPAGAVALRRDGARPRDRRRRLHPDAAAPRRDPHGPDRSRGARGAARRRTTSA